MAQQTLKPKLETSFKLVSQTPKAHKARKQIVRKTKNIEEKNVTQSDIARLMWAIYDDAANSYQKACVSGGKKSQQECMQHLQLIEELFGEIAICNALEKRN